MEIYSITCKINNKIYIGSTVNTKEERFFDRFSRFSHINKTNNGDNAPLYQDIRKFGVDNFILDTVEYVGQKGDWTQKQLHWLEDKYIKHYWDLLGEDMMYNQMRSAYTNSDSSQMQTPEARQKQHLTFLEKYNSPYGKLHSEESKENRRRAQSRKIEYKGIIVYGRFEFCRQLNKDGYDIINPDIAGDILSNRRVSKRIREMYPELDPANENKIWKIKER